MVAARMENGMTASDFMTLAFLAGAVMLAPRTLTSTIVLVGIAVICGMISIIAGDMEMLIAVGAVLGTLLIGYLSVLART
jgi:hypothetical protein